MFSQEFTGNYVGKKLKIHTHTFTHSIAPSPTPSHTHTITLTHARNNPTHRPHTLSKMNRSLSEHLSLHVMSACTSLRSSVCLHVNPCPSVCPDPGVGAAQHEALRAGGRVLPQPGGGVWGSEGGVGCHQEHEEEPQLPQLRALHTSGEAELATHTHTYTHIYTHTYTHTRMNTHTHLCVREFP